MYARVTEIRFPPSLDKEVVGAAKGLVNELNAQRGYKGLDVLTDALAGEGLIVSFWDTAADAEASETDSSYIAQMSMMSSFLTEKLAPRAYQASVRN